jgi:hypothetical protein
LWNLDFGNDERGKEIKRNFQWKNGDEVTNPSLSDNSEKNDQASPILVNKSGVYAPSS